MKKIRLDRELSQENIAEELKVDSSTIGRYESGERPIKFEQVATLAEFYGMTLDELYHYGDPTFIKPSEIEIPTYQRKRNIVVSIELDGTPITLNFWLEKLRKLNAALV